jgi:hypothetical protein
MLMNISQTSVPPASAPAAAPATKTTSRPPATPAPAASDPPTLATARAPRLERRLSLRRTSLPRLKIERLSFLLTSTLFGVLLLAMGLVFGKGEMHGQSGVIWLRVSSINKWMDGRRDRRIVDGV